MPVDLRAEIALLHARFYLFGEAHAALRAVPPEVLGAHTYYRRSLEMVDPTVALCGERADLRYPECLIDVILEEVAADPISYEPRQGHVVTVSSTLGQGGGERQTLTVLERMAGDPRLERAALYVRSVTREDQRFFLPAARKLPIELTIYGENWTTRSDLAAEAPELARRPRLAAAVELLPQNLREDLIRLFKRFREERPQAVHLRQDLFGGALACAVAGVPRFFVHRGSLSPDRWEHNRLQAQIYIRPMRHTYRRLLAHRPDFVIVNNSRMGGDGDRAWTEWPDPARFRVIYNAIAFDQLGTETGRNVLLRERLGVPADAFVVGGAFRFVPVKRPMLWIEVARRVAEACPAAHFLIIGDGEMRAEVVAHAERHGFAERLHLPGRVSDVGNWFRAMDLQLLTSEREGLPNVLIEAQHVGVPAVSADVGGAGETIEPGVTGILVPPDAGAEAFADAVLSAIRDPAWHAAARARAPVFVHETFDADRVVDQIMELYGIDARRPA